MSAKFGLLVDFDLLKAVDINKYDTVSSIEAPRPPF